VKEFNFGFFSVLFLDFGVKELLHELDGGSHEISVSTAGSGLKMQNKTEAEVVTAARGCPVAGGELQELD